MLREQDWKDVLAEDKAQDDKWGSQIDYPLGTGVNEEPLLGMVIVAESRKLGRRSAKDLADLARAACQKEFAEGKGTWVGILLEEVMEAFAEEGGDLGGEALEAELLQVATVALKMRQAARHKRTIAEMRKREVDTILLYGVFPNCRHRNYGTRDKPASVMYDCIDCRDYYCDMCNYDRHICGGCGDPYRHGEGPHSDGKWCIDDEDFPAVEEPTA